MKKETENRRLRRLAKEKKNLKNEKTYENKNKGHFRSFLKV